MTPLTEWNPLNITYKGWQDSIEGQTVTAGHRSGGPLHYQAYSGSNDHVFYRTPEAFFYPDGPSNEVVTVLNQSNQSVRAAGSGFRINIPVDGIGLIRQRYPIPPVHAGGSLFREELEALKAILLSPKTYSYMFHKPIDEKLNTTAARK